jgi:molybdopterin converting factor small subunit
MPQIQIPSPLRQYSGKQASVDVPAKTVGEALAGLVTQHPDLKRHLYTDDGKLRSFVNVYVNDEDMRYLQKEATALKEGDTISIVPSIAGGGLMNFAQLGFGKLKLDRLDFDKDK